MKKLTLLSLITCIAFLSYSQDFTPENLGANVNSADGDNGPVISPDGKTLYFWSTRGGATSFYSELDSTGNWSAAKPLEEPFKSKSAKVCAITPDGNKLLVYYKSNGRATYAFSNKIKNGWGELEVLTIEGYPEKTEDNYFMKASLSNDGNRIVMVISDPLNPKSKYKTDLFTTFLQKNNTWSKPVHLGNRVNKMESEIAPFLSSDNKTLFFSRHTEESDQNFDIYKTIRLDSTWTNWSDPEKLGTNINDERWNADYTIPASGNYAYMASSKKPLAGTYTDIIRIKLRDEEKPHPVVLISGKVINSKTSMPIEAKITYENLENGMIIGAASTNPETGKYKVILPYGVNYGVTAFATNYLSVSDNINLVADTKGTYLELTKNLMMIPIEIGETIRINNLFFETAKSEIKTESYSELDRLVSFLINNPKINIQINGHTDNDGSADLNKKLSEARAKAVKAYLISKQVTETRIIAMGFGASKPVDVNTNELGKQKNRRVEFVILSK